MRVIFVLGSVNECLWGFILLPLTIFVGAVLLCRCGGLKFFKFHKIFKIAFSKSGNNGVSPFGAMCTALSGTMGIGNIAGVGTAIALGGCGAVFWMTVSAFLCMALKFSEVALAVEYRSETDKGFRGGLFYIIENALPKIRPLGVVFAVLTVMCSAGTGGVSQSGSAAAAMESAFGVPKWQTGAVIGLVCLILLSVSAMLLSKIEAAVIPILTLMFTGGCVAVIISAESSVFDAVFEILSDAFDFKSVFGGVGGFAVSSALRYGVSRGVFTNEAGMGSAPIVHSETSADPLKQGCLGIIEVLTDTVIMCPITALAIICTDSHRLCGVSPVNFTQAAFSSVFGRSGTAFVAIASLLFAIGSSVGWSFYGRRASEYLFGSRRFTAVYCVLFCVITAFGACLPELQIFELADILNGLMMLPSLFVLMILSKRAGDIAKGLKK